MACVVSGCGRPIPLGEVQGTARLDGRPIDQVLVSFLPDPAKQTRGPRSAAATDAAGRFRLRCDDGREGAVVGWHRVLVEDLKPYAAPRSDNPDRPAVVIPSRIPSAYRDPAKTPLRLEVRAEPQELSVELSSRPR